MAASTAPLVWDFYRTCAAGDPGGVVHYFDEQSQSLYLSSGLQTRIAEVKGGHWDATPTNPIEIGDLDYTRLRIDHPGNGVLYMAASNGTSLDYLRYLYAMDLSDLIASGSWQEQTDNKIKQLSANVKNVGELTFCAENTLFNPGSRLTLAFAAGDSEPLPVGVAYVDDVDFDVYADTVPISGRNSIGYLLADQTMDNITSITGTANEVVAQILTMAGVTKYAIGPSEDTHTHTFKPEQTLLSAIEQVCKYYDPWRIEELADGTILVGYPWWITPTYLTNSIYQFNGGSEVFKRKTNKNADAAYTHIRVNGKDAAGTDLAPVLQPVNNWDYWALGAHKTQHITAPDGLTQEGLAAYAASVAESMQYVGIGEQFSSPLRPWLLVGDVAAIYNDGDAQAVSLGLITELTHSFGESGYGTDFSVDSGGMVTDAASYITTRNAALRGFNRRQRITDLIGVKIDRR